MIQPDKRCKNCGQHLLLHQKFCHHCGQKTATHRIDFHFLIHEIQHGIFHVDGGILYTLRQLFTRPGHMLRDYLDGKRQPHFKPLLLVVILGSLCSLIQYMLKPRTENQEEGERITTQITDTAASKYVDFQGLIEYFREIFNWLGGHFAITVLLMLPAAALGFYLGFRKYRYNYAEWLVILLFLTAQSLAVYAFFIPFNQLAGISIGWFYLISWLLITISLIQFCDCVRKRFVIIRSFWSMFLTYFISLFYIITAVFMLAFIGLVRYGYTGLLPKLIESW
ncbi:DUF3667 domain-containing protein [Marnyiella aurantia]|uniref:DUF3667 domain-containing protein n=1 Tax=Marnyiella aurantia TaxID=2758037 RepID=A0A7D7LRH3_9FLAO|nr:DUF3667 domain-containing protein [Marnyiella aurantia]MBA5246517.1 DUF3667 domain-containing protein [Marnyiella aurantia]QMS98117.1 DUF3667 domain-containing protein [Marnyiella aurantia]